MNNKNVVEQIQFDHINFRVDYSLSNLYFNNTGLSETKKLISDKQKSGTNFSLSDGSKIDIIALEKKLIEIGDFDDIMKYLNKDAYKMLPLLACFSEAYTNAKSNEQIQNGFLGSFLYSDIRNRENLNLNSNTYFASIIINKNKKINKSNIKQIIINEKINEVGMLNNREKTIDYTSTENEEHNKNLLSFENLSIEEFIYKISNDTNYNDTNFQYLYALGKAMLKAINH
ncbi:MAG: hypothetical protein Q4F88_00390 [Eubacteriales bacterium]|nr:hypothetical protein [Eubacteriales bacterium]